MYDEIKKIIAKYKRIVFFTGAGMSTESGIPDFRSDSGLYSEKNFMDYAPEKILSRSFFISRTDIFYKYYFERIIYRDAKPNTGHSVIASLEEKGYEITVVTQNIDGFHSIAGSKKVLELHGNVHKNKCMECNEVFSLEEMLDQMKEVPKCSKCGGILKPEVTLYEEALDNDIYVQAVDSIINAEVLFVVGSSLTVYPAAGILNYFKGKAFIIINKTPTDFDDRSDYVLNGSAGEILDCIFGGI